MKRLSDFDEFRQGVPKNKKYADLETGRVHVVGVQYVTVEDFMAMQTELKEKVDAQITVLEQTLIELKQIKLHLASLSNEAIEEEDVEDD